MIVSLGVESSRERLMYAFWDVEHPTTRLHELIADALYTSVLDCESVQGPRSRSASNRSASRCSLNVP